MEIRIGIINAQREIGFETDQSASDIESAVSSALDGGAKYLRLTDSKGTIFLVPTETLAYVEIGSEAARRVGFVG